MRNLFKIIHFFHITKLLQLNIYQKKKKNYSKQEEGVHDDDVAGDMKSLIGRRHIDMTVSPNHKLPKLLCNHNICLGFRVSFLTI